MVASAFRGLVNAKAASMAAEQHPFPLDTGCSACKAQYEM